MGVRGARAEPECPDVNRGLSHNLMLSLSKYEVAALSFYKLRMRAVQI